MLNLFSFSSCKEILGKKKIKEGEIIYAVSYPRSENNMMVSLMPGEMVMRFKDNKISNEFSASMGMFYMNLIPDLENKTLTQMVQVMGDKKCYVYKSDEVQRLVEEQPAMKIELKKDTKMIAGYECKKAVVSFQNDEKPAFDLYYTEDIDIKEPNWFTVFAGIKGVILEYEISRYNIDMRLEAKSVSPKPVDGKIFAIPADFKKVTQAEIDEIFESF